MTSAHPLNPQLPELVAISGGPFMLHDEGSKRTWKVQVSDFALCPRPVSQGLFDEVMGRGPAPSQGANFPVTDVSWLEALQFCNRLSELAGFEPVYGGSIDGAGEGALLMPGADGFRLPTEAEWEYACRAGSRDPRYGALDAIAWHRGNSDERLHLPGELAPNAWGLFDMLGNVWEWCWDLYDPEVYGAYRVFRGGGFSDQPRACRASCRRKSHPTFKIDDLGFRVARGAQEVG